jgi:hypothetical protein
MKNKRGRPKLAKNKAKGVLVAARFSPEEVKTVERAVARSRKNKSEWVRATLLTAAQSDAPD